MRPAVKIIKPIRAIYVPCSPMADKEAQPPIVKHAPKGISNLYNFFKVTPRS